MEIGSALRAGDKFGTHSTIDNVLTLNQIIANRNRHVNNDIMEEGYKKDTSNSALITFPTKVTS